MRNVTKTSTQAQMEKEMNKEKDSENICPECNQPNFGVRVVKEGFFKHETTNEYSCFNCGCEWNTGWRKI